jgi:outer membrane lipoprotein-sorting protein
MIPSPIRFTAVVCAAIAVASTVSAQTAILTKARANLGPEAALEGVKSIHYIGTMVAGDPADPSTQVRATMDIIFQKERQRIVATDQKYSETTALDGYEAWQRTAEAKDPSKFRQVALPADRVKALRATTWENLSFFRGIEKVGGRLEVLEPATIDGVACHKIAFIHGPNIVFTRYFDQATGKLVLTELGSTTTIREQGEMVVGQIRFPKSIITESKNAAGKVVRKTTITFDEIKLNETFPDSLFAFPGMGRK